MELMLTYAVGLHAGVTWEISKTSVLGFTPEVLVKLVCGALGVLGMGAFGDPT